MFPRGWDQKSPLVSMCDALRLLNTQKQCCFIMHEVNLASLNKNKHCWHLLSPSKLASSTPLPLSDTSTSSAPHSFSLTSETCKNVTLNQKPETEMSPHVLHDISAPYHKHQCLPMLVAPASMLFSTSSLTAVARVSTTCPEQIWCTECLSMALMALAGSELLRRKYSICWQGCNKS